MMPELTKTNRIAVVIIVCLCIVQQFAVDCYVPSLPAIANSFNVTDSSVQLSITFFLLGAVPAQFVFGTLSDSFGRRPLYLVGMIIFVLSCLLCLFATNISLFLCGRFLQGFGIGSGFVLAWATTRDMFSGKKFIQAISILGAVTVLIPVISPIVGGYIQLYLGWHYIFILLLIMGILLLTVTMVALPETLKAESKQVLHIKNIYESYKTLFTSRIFLSNSLASCFTTSTMIIYITITPFLYQQVLHLTPVSFSWVTALVAIGVAIGCIVNSKLIEKIGGTKLIALGVGIMSAGVVSMLIFALMNIISLYAILLPMLIVTLSIGFIVPNTTSCALDPFDKLAGSASALYSGLQMFIFSNWSAIAAVFHTENQKPLTFLLLTLPIIIVALRQSGSSPNN